MKPGEEIRIDEYGDERFWFVSHPESYGPVWFLNEDGNKYSVHRAFAMTIAQYEQSCEMRERAKQFNYKVVV